MCASSSSSLFTIQVRNSDAFGWHLLSVRAAAFSIYDKPMLTLCGGRRGIDFRTAPMGGRLHYDQICDKDRAKTWHHPSEPAHVVSERETDVSVTVSANGREGPVQRPAHTGNYFGAGALLLASAHWGSARPAWRAATG